MLGCGEKCGRSVGGGVKKCVRVWRSGGGGMGKCVGEWER